MWKVVQNQERSVMPRKGVREPPKDTLDTVN